MTNRTIKRKILKFIEQLKNINGNFDGQKLSEKWFISHDIEFLDYFKEHNLFDIKNLYMYITGESDKCVCGETRRFKNFKNGFSEHCEKCAKSTFNYMKKPGKKEIEVLDVVKYVKDSKGNYSSTKLKSLSQTTIESLISLTPHLIDPETTVSERIYNIENNISELPNCEVCGKPHNNYYFKDYKNTCKGKCAYEYAFSHKTSESLKTNFYLKYLEKYQSNDQYEISMFSLDDYLKSKNCNIKFKHLKCGHEYVLDVKYQGHTKCPKCFPIRSKKQYEIYEWLSNFIDVKMNDRQLLKPLELDLLTQNFAIEYDSLMFHSYGMSTIEKFNDIVENKTYHLNKTELCESKNIQLFRIFSNEWANKQEIWKSVLMSKLGITGKVYARKCILKEISNSVAKEFFDLNHLQGYVNSSVRIGLYYNEELVCAMTFGKTRRSKWSGDNNFELLRFASKLNTTVIGGGSKILKYFEGNYNPELLISYANRRWSTGNFYTKMGFDFIENTTPNYFYFKGNDGSNLLSREVFQKHKLKDKLEIFDENLSETQNMYNNGYRKIYDCGNMVFCKKY